MNGAKHASKNIVRLSEPRDNEFDQHMEVVVPMDKHQGVLHDLAEAEPHIIVYELLVVIALVEEEVAKVAKVERKHHKEELRDGALVELQ